MMMKMRNLYIFLLALFLLTSCNNESDSRFKGEWELIEFALIGMGGDPMSDEETLRNAGAIWDMQFKGNGDFRQNFNMRTAEMEMEVEEGTWKATEDSLIIKLQIDIITSRMAYTYKMEGDTLSLLLAPEGAPTQVKTKFRRK